MLNSQILIIGTVPSTYIWNAQLAFPSGCLNISKLVQNTISFSSLHACLSLSSEPTYIHSSSQPRTFVENPDSNSSALTDSTIFLLKIFSAPAFLGHLKIRTTLIWPVTTFHHTDLCLVTCFLSFILATSQTLLYANQSLILKQKHENASPLFIHVQQNEDPT